MAAKRPEDTNEPSPGNSIEINEILKRFEAEQQAARAEIQELKTRLVSQESELQSLRQLLSSNALNKIAKLGQSKPTSRRAMLRKVGGVAAGLTAFGIASSLSANAAMADSPAIDADGSGGASASYGGQFKGDLAPLHLVAATGNTTHNTVTNGRQSGELFVDPDGSLWYNTGAKWVQLSAASQVVYLSSPVRVVGKNTTMSDGTTPYPNGFPLIDANTVPSYFMIEGSWGTAANPLVIPNNAVAVMGFFTVIGTTGGGFATVYPADTSRPVVATVNYGSGATMTASFTSRLGVMPNAGTLYPQGVSTTGKKGLAVASLAACSIAIEIVAYIL